MGFTRTQTRTEARRLYDKFGRLWRRDLRMSGLYGKKGSPKKPTFSAWYKMHLKDTTAMKQSTPSDVSEYLQLDPWIEQEMPELAPAEPKEERGVVVIPMAGSDEE